MIGKNFKISTLCLALLAANGAFAEETVDLGTTKVWGTKVISDVSALDEKDIAIQQADHLSDLLRTQPGIEIGGTHSLNQRINMRGLDDTDLNITLDGANQNTYMFHHAGNLIFNADILKSIETSVGRNSVVNTGLGGAVAMETKDPSDLLRTGESFGTRLNFGYASNKQLGGSVTVYGKANNGFDAMLYTTLIDRDNPKDGSGFETVGNNGDIQNTLVKVGKNFSNGDRIELSYDMYDDEGDYSSRPDMGARTNFAIDSGLVRPTEFKRNTLAVNGDFSLNDKFLVNTHLSHNVLNLSRITTADDGSKSKSEGEAVNIRASSQVEADFSTGSVLHAITTGLDALSQEGTSLLNGAERSKEKTTTLSVYAEDKVGITPIFSITPGVRYDRYKANTASSTKTHSEVTGALAAEAAFKNGFTARLSGVQLFKGPEMAEVFINEADGLVNNPNIAPETGLNTELSLQYKQSNVLGADKFSVKLTGYKTDIKDAIVAEDYPNDSLTGRGAPQWFVNGSDLELTGGELSAYYKKGNVGVNLGYATSDSKFKDTGLPVDREIGDKLVLGFDYAVPVYGLTLNLTGIHLFEEDHTTNDVPKDAYTVVNFVTNWQPQRMQNVNFRLAVDNLFDKQYVSHASRIGDTVHPVFGALNLNDYEPGRNIKVSASYQF